MQPDTYQGVSPGAKKSTIEELNPGEQKLTEVKRHPFGIIVIIVGTMLALFLALFLIVFLLPSFNEFLG